MEKLENKISHDIRGAIFKVYQNLCPGLLESVYESALAYELLKSGRKVKKQEGQKSKIRSEDKRKK